MKKIKHILEFLGTRLLYSFAGLLSLKFARTLGQNLGRFGFAVIKIRRHHTLANLANAFPQLSKSEIEKLGVQAYQNFGMSMFEYVHATSSKHDQLIKHIQIENSHLLDAALKAGKGAILLTAHFGGWESAAAWLSLNGYPVTFMYKKPKNPYIDKLILQTRESFGMNMVERNLGVRTYLKTIKSGKFACLLADQDGGRKGIFVDFMGRPASTPVGPAVFAYKTGAPLIFFVLYRDKQNQLHLCFEKIDYDIAGMAKEKAIEYLVKTYTSHLEKWIKKYPNQWFWMHRRWMTKEKNPVNKTTGSTNKSHPN
ncbi:MAG: hypothetical protein DWQ05_02890 [Calditrichaeota bacterium]|nr:MAG: hypothetical protein DWQ05_02890 [Calditrichota bacterium]